MQSVPAPNRFLLIQRRIQVSGRDSAGLQSVHLIFHERDERRNHNGQAFAYQSRQLKTEGLATAGWHQHKHIAPGERIADDLTLQRPESVVPEMLFERTDQIHFSVYRENLRASHRQIHIVGNIDLKSVCPAELHSAESVWLRVTA